MIDLRLLGPLEIAADDGRDMSGLLRQPKRTALLAYLASDRARPTARRDLLLALFWPELDETHARGALNTALLFLRRHLGDDVVVSRSADVGLAPGAVRTDAAAMQEAAAAGRFAEALELYRGPLLEGFHADTGGFEDWMALERSRLKDLAAEAARKVVNAAISEGRPAAAINSLHRWLAIAPDDARAITRLVQVLHATGDPAGALREYAAHIARLQRDFGLTPPADLEGAADQVRRGAPPPFRLPGSDPRLPVHPPPRGTAPNA